MPRLRPSELSLWAPIAKTKLRLCKQNEKKNGIINQIQGSWPFQIIHPQNPTYESSWRLFIIVSVFPDIRPLSEYSNGKSQLLLNTIGSFTHLALLIKTTIHLLQMNRFTYTLHYMAHMYEITFSYVTGLYLVIYPTRMFLKST